MSAHLVIAVSVKSSYPHATLIFEFSIKKHPQKIKDFMINQITGYCYYVYKKRRIKRMHWYSGGAAIVSE